jgi:hypothetical protein
MWWLFAINNPAATNLYALNKIWRIDSCNGSVSLVGFHRGDETLIGRLAYVDAAFPRSTIQTSQSSQ